MGLFYEKCLVVEIYQNTCFCDNFLTGELVQVVGYHSNTVYANHYGGFCQKSQHSAVQDQVPCADVYVMYGVQYFHLGPPSLPLPLPIQLENRGLIFAFQLMGGVIIICLAILMCGFVFLCLWMIPVKLPFYLTLLKW